jgi:hypothetical protein
LVFSPNVSLVGYIIAACAICEVISAIYQHILIHAIQSPAPPSELPLKQRFELLLKVLGADLAGQSRSDFDGSQSDIEAEDADQVDQALSDAEEHQADAGGSCVRVSGHTCGTETPPLVRLVRDIAPSINSLMDEHGKPVRLESTDARAVQLRERLRTWQVWSPPAPPLATVMLTA